jgi:DNA-directed RNA polymerase specialized sigma24 family protein
LSPDSERAYAFHAEHIRQAIAIVCRRQHLRNLDAEDFAQDAWLHLLEHDGRRIRRFTGESSALTYFTRVLTNLWVDQRRHADGRWRPSAVAKLQGPVGLDLERMVLVEGLTLEQAVQTVLSRRSATLHEVTSILVSLRLRCRANPRHVGRLENPERAGEASVPATAESDLVASEESGHAKHVAQMISRSWALLQDSERRVLVGVAHGRFGRRNDPAGTPDAATVLVLQEFKNILSSGGVTWAAVSAALSDPGVDLGLTQRLKRTAIRRALKEQGICPSTGRRARDSARTSEAGCPRSRPGDGQNRPGGGRPALDRPGDPGGGGGDLRARRSPGQMDPTAPSPTARRCARPTTKVSRRVKALLYSRLDRASSEREVAGRLPWHRQGVTPSVPKGLRRRFERGHAPQP